jgi:hypothetical protein
MTHRKAIVILSCMIAVLAGIGITSGYFALKALFWTVPSLLDELRVAAVSSGADRASIDFSNGKTHHYRAEPLPASGRQTYDKNAAVVPRSYTEWPGSQLSAETFARSYNGRMDVLIRRRDKSEEPER